MSVLWTFPGKLGDTLLEWPIAKHWCKLRGKRITVGLSEATEPLRGLLLSQPEVEKVVILRDRIKDFSVGGQPADFGFTKTDYWKWDEVFHAGMLAFPNTQITEFTARCLRIPYERDDLKEPSIVLPFTEPQRFDRVLLHGKKLSNQGGDPRFWAIAGRLVRSGVLARYFSEMEVIGTEDEIRDARNRLGVTAYFSDEGDWLKLAQHILHSGLVVDAASGIAALAGALGVPCIRVHDDIQNFPHTIWSNQPTPFQMNMDVKLTDKDVHAFLEELDDARRADRPIEHRELENLAPTGLGAHGFIGAGEVEVGEHGGASAEEAGVDR